MATSKVFSARKAREARKHKQAMKPVHPKAKMTFRHHIVPPMLGFLVFASILGLLNGEWITAQIQYHYAKPVAQTNLVIPTDAPSKAAVNLQIPSIGVNAPVVYDETSYNENKVQLALRRGIVHYGTTALPGQAGNIVMLGHSSGQLWAPGDYKFVFTHLDKTKDGDRIILDYKGTRYIYKVSGREIVEPSDLRVTQPTKDPRLTLITCTPVGTSKNRLVITAKQVSPKPETATPLDPEQVKPVTAWSIPR